jgi:large subunit ribosomal protein L24
VKIKKGDRVEVLSGKERGKTGEVTFAYPSEQRIIVAGVNISKRHTRPARAMSQGGIIDKDMPMPVSKVAILCSKCGPTRVGYSIDAGRKKIRICKKCGDEL